MKKIDPVFFKGGIFIEFILIPASGIMASPVASQSVHRSVLY